MHALCWMLYRTSVEAQAAASCCVQGKQALRLGCIAENDEFVSISDS